jgi:hypothetical protein
VLIQFVDIVGRQSQIVFSCDIDDRLRTDRTLAVTVDLGLRDIVVFGVEVFHKASVSLFARSATAGLAAVQLLPEH